LAKRKLHIPAPDGQEEEVEGDISIVFLSAIFCFGLACSLLYFFSFVQTSAKSADAGPSERAEEVDPRQKLLKEQRALAATFDEFTGEQFDEHEWKEEEEVAVFRFGPRRATETLCRKHKDAIVSGKLDPIRSIELLKSLERRVEFAPWTCMNRLFLAGELPEDGPLDREMTKFWKDLRQWKGNPRLIMSVLADFRETRDRPAVPEFYRWVRLCALNYDYQGATECRRLLRQISPQQGTDILAMTDRHLRETTRLEDDEAGIVIAALGRLARNGQPPNWKVVEDEGIPDYDADLRNATVLFLCRFVHSPNTEHAVKAAEELRRVADAAGRAYDARLLERWRETCRIGFDGGRTSEERRAIPIVASWDGVEGNPPDYSLEVVQKLGHCARTPRRPVWWCGAEQWAGKLEDLERATANYFIETRYMEWPAPSEPLLSPP
jgi:hypothetical protein